MVISKEFVQEVNGIVADESLVLGIDEAVPVLLWEASQNIVVLSVELNIVFVEVVEEILGSQNLCYLDKLVRVAVSMEERLFAENHGCKHGPQRPHIQGIVILLEINEELRPLKVSRCHTDIVLGSGMVELCKTPIDQAQFPLLVIDHDVMWLYITMHDTFAVAEIEGLGESVILFSVKH